MKYQDTNKELAELLGWTDIWPACGPQPMTGMINAVRKPIPRWCSDSTLALDLISPYTYTVTNMEDWGVSVYIDGAVQGCMTDLSEHANYLAALRYVMVCAVMQELRNNI